MRSRNSQVHTSSSIFSGIVPGKKWKIFLPRRIIWQKWQDVVGDAVSRQACPWYFSGLDCLVVAVSDNIWMQQLTFQASIILDGLNRHLPSGSKLKEVRFRLADVERVRKNSKPGIATSGLSRSYLRKKTPPPPEALELVDNLQDTELKKILHSLLEKAS